MDQGLMTLTMVIKMLNVSRSTIYRWINDGSIPAIKVGKQWRFERGEIEEWLKKRGNQQRLLKS
jgi:excisionase family DNA binding protein